MWCRYHRGLVIEQTAVHGHKMTRAERYRDLNAKFALARV